MQNIRTTDCAAFREYCPMHGIHHHQCGECGADCTLGTPDGPATTELDGVTRCFDCNRRLSRFQAIGAEADVARKAVAEWRKAEGFPARSVTRLRPRE